MKKIIFTLQVFGILILFPIYVILEMNHGTRDEPTSHFKKAAIEQTGKLVARSRVIPGVRNSTSGRVSLL